MTAKEAIGITITANDAALISDEFYAGGRLKKLFDIILGQSKKGHKSFSIDFGDERYDLFSEGARGRLRELGYNVWDEPCPISQLKGPIIYPDHIDRTVVSWG